MTTPTAQGIGTFGGMGDNANEQFSGSQVADTNAIPVLRIVAKNVRGLKTDERIHELITELKTTKTWDIVILTETWRVDEMEMFATNEGHLFANAGCEAGRRGVGFLVHRRWTKFLLSFVPINERVATLTLRKHKFKVQIVGVYFPHCGYSDECVQQVYDILTNVLHEARTSKDHVVIAGDFNAEVGKKR